jgi:NADH:ubiquinone oxidoreductase subunit F (NADH-binding)
MAMNHSIPGISSPTTPSPTDPRRLLAGWAEAGRPEPYHAHLDRHGPPRLPSGATARDRYVQEVTDSGLTGRGGGGFPTGRKLASVGAGRGRAVVVGNACESDPSSHKDLVLAEHSPHLVLDGLLGSAAAVQATDSYLCAHRGTRTFQALDRALAQRPDCGQVVLVDVPPRFVSSEESALAQFLSGGQARPRTRPPGVFQSGVHGRPTLVQNIETLAHLALVGRYGAGWFRALGTEQSPGTALADVTGAVRRPGVLEVAYGTSLTDLVVAMGGVSEPVQSVLVGGFGGTWVSTTAARTLSWCRESLVEVGASLGVGSLFLLPARVCPLTETARLLAYLAKESAGQCGPCMFGLPAIAADFAALATGAAGSDPTLLERVQRRLAAVLGRGACAHPDGAVRLARSALVAFAPDVAEHLNGRPCRAAGSPPFLPVPRPDTAALAPAVP